MAKKSKSKSTSDDIAIECYHECLCALVAGVHALAPDTDDISVDEWRLRFRSMAYMLTKLSPTAVDEDLQDTFQALFDMRGTQIEDFKSEAHKRRQ